MGKILNENNKYPLIIMIILCLFVSAVALAVIFSNIKFDDPVDGTIATILNEGDLVINYVDGNEIEFSDTKEHTFGITLTNSGENKIYYSLGFSSANKNNIMVTLKGENGDVISSMSEDITNNKIINLASIEGNETIRYTLVLKNKEKTSFKGTLKVVNESLSTELFSDIILLNNNISTAKTRIGTDTATSNEGLIQTTDSKGTAYFFRGDVDNNYVKLGEKYFRIVRINGDSTVRLVLDGVLNEKYAYNTNVVAEGQNITDLVKLSNASLYGILNNWVQTDLGEYAKNVTEGDFCTDLAFNNAINGINYAPTYDRVFKDRAPDIVCEGTATSLKVGLLSVDEVILAGSADTQENKKYYLYNENITDGYLTMSSLSLNTANNLAMVDIMNNGAIGSGKFITDVVNIRPVINIGVSAKVKGTGTKNNPYIIVS